MNIRIVWLILCQVCFIFANESHVASISTRHLLSRQRTPSTSLTEKKSSPTKQIKVGSNEKRATPIYIRPSKSTTHKHKSRSYSDLLTDKTNKKPSKTETSKKKKSTNKVKNETNREPVSMSKVRELVPINDVELERCRVLLSAKKIDSTPVQDETKTKKKNEETTKNTVVEQPVKAQENRNKKSVENSATKKNEESGATTKVDETRTKKTTPPPSSSSSTTTTTTTTTAKSEEKPKNNEVRTKKSNENIVASVGVTTNGDETVSNSSVVDRAFHFVKNMFQLSDDSLEVDASFQQTLNDDQTETHYRSRKLLSIDEFQGSMMSSISKRSLLSSKSNKSKKPPNQSPTTNHHNNNSKPKVGWAYRYRISRYLAAQKQQQQSGKRNKTSNEKVNLKSKDKKVKTSVERKTAKRKLLQVDHPENHISKENVLDSVTITQPFRPKRLHKEKPGDARSPSTVDDRKHESYRMKYSEPILLVPSHEAKRRREKLSTSNGEIRQTAEKKKENLKDQTTKHSSEKEETKKKPIESSTSLLQTLISKAQSSTCFLPFTKDRESCQESFSSQNPIESKGKAKRRLRTKKEHVAKQFIRSRPTKLGVEQDKATERRVDELMKILYSSPSLPPIESPPHESNVETTNSPRFRTISEVIREQADVFIPQNRDLFRTAEQIQEENTESFAEKTKLRSSSNILSLDRNKRKL